MLASPIGMTLSQKMPIGDHLSIDIRDDLFDIDNFADRFE